MAVLGSGDKPLVRAWYPHMMEEDSQVWSRFLASKESAPIERVWYDVHVGKAVPLLPDGADWLYKVASGVSRKRIDCVCQVVQGWWVVEVKPYANAVALGQVLSYTRLFVQEYELVGQCWPVVVCDVVDRDLVDDFKSHGVVVFETGYEGE